MRVLHVFKTYLPDNFAGIERVIWQIAESTAPFGVRTDVLSLSAHPSSSPLNIDHHQVHQAKLDFYIASTGISLSVFWKFAQLRDSVDLIHYHFPWPMMDLMHLLSAGKPSVVTYHSDIVRQKSLSVLYRPLMHRFLDSVDAIVATSPDYAMTSPVLRRHANAVSIIPIGIDDAIPAHAVERVSIWRKRLNGPFFLFVGALRYYKGLQFLLAAARRTGYPVVIAGSGDASILESAANLDNVYVIGTIDEADKHALLQLCTAFVFPSHLRSEAFGVALLEAARSGRAMISTAMGTGTSYVNCDGITGITVEPGNVDQLASAMTTMWENPRMVVGFGEQARARYERLFTARGMGQAYVALYRQFVFPDAVLGRVDKMPNPHPD